MASESPKPKDLATMSNDSDDSNSSTEVPAPATSSTTDTLAQPSQPTTQEDTPDAPSQPGQETTEQSGAVNAWLSQEDEDDDGNDWLASDDAVHKQTQQEETQSEATPEQAEHEQASTQPADTEPVETEPVDTEQVDTEQVDPAPEDTEAVSQPKGPVSQHSSSRSFARTVSHEISFGDDDEGEWTLSRTDTDPFKFMPPSDRTNSFPPVPPVHSTTDAEDQQPLPANQAMDVLEETEKEAEAEEELYQHEEASEGLEAPKRRGHSSSISIGGDLKSPEGQDSDERYEAGIPLIPQSAEETNEATAVQENHPTADPFDEEEGEDGADFFSQVQGSGPVGEEQPVPALERKSTMQVLDSMNAGSVPKSTLEGTPEEEEEDDSDSDDSEDKSEDEKAAQADSTPAASEPAPAKQEDLASKWEQAFADDEDDDDFLLDDNAGGDKQVDPAAFFGSDDEGFLEDEEPVADSTPAPAPASFPASHQPPAPNPYMPQAPVIQQAPSPYAPVSQVPGVAVPPTPMYNSPAPGTAPFGSAPQYGQPPPARPDMSKAQSFADKSKGGYHSPYDLPTDLVTNVVKPRKRASMQQLSQPNYPHAPVQAPPRSASVGMPAPPTKLTPPSSSHGLPAQQAGPPNPTTSGAQHKENFFEELPMTSRPRPSSRTSQRAASPARNPPPMAHTPHVPSPLAPSFPNQMPPPSIPVMAPPPSEPYSEPPTQAPVPGAGLVAPERVSPYAALTTSANHMPPPTSTSASRYSPAPGTSHTAPPAPVANRYSPAPPATKTHGSYGAVATSGPAPMLPHQPRTSSPLTHSETAHFEPRLSRVSSLPPTREVDEEDDQQTQTRSVSATLSPPPQESRYNPTSPPPPSYAGQLTLSPPKQSGPYAPHAAPTAHPGFVPPPRAQTQSPSAAFGHRQAQGSSDSTRRPSSAHSHSHPSPLTAKPAPSPYAPAAPAAPAAGVSTVRTRGQSITMNMIAPTDGREHDELQRWKGVPIISWGVGGTIVTSFPKSVPRYGMNQAVPMIVRTPGEVKVQSVKDIEPLHEHVAKFPGPLRGKSKKKETISWLNAGIELLEKDLPDVSFHSQLSLEAKRAVERLLLWKIMRIFVENDGALEGTPAVEAAVRDVLSPGENPSTTGDDAVFPAAGNFAAGIASITSMQADGVDVSTMDQVRHHLLRGDRDKAVWALVDKRLWGHAMLISHTVEGDLYKRVAQEFVRKEVNYPGHANESMAALYKILSGNFEDCVDELVPVHARAGLQLMSTDAGPGPTKDTLDGLDKWRETLSLVLSNRSTDDIQGLNALGNLLSSYGRAEAAHICFIFGRHSSIFGGLDDPNANFVLIGADHRQQSDQFAKETEALQLSEVYEYGLSLAGGALAAAGTPHLAAYKLEHAMTLAEYGHRDKAMQYCDAILTAMSSQTKRSPYHHHVLETAVEDFMSRLKSAPKEESGSWISKPSMNKVSDSMWNRFNKFVAGDETEDNAGGAGEAGPFTRPSGEFSRSPSVSNFDIYGQQSPSFGMTSAQPPANAAASKYAPATMTPAASLNPYSPTSQYTPGRSSMEQTPADFGNNPYEPGYPGAASASQGDSYTPSIPQPESNNPGVGGSVGLAPPAQITQGYSPAGYQPYGMPASAPMGGDENPADSSAQGFQPLSYGYEAPQMSSNPPEQESEKNNGEAHSSGYEPPSFQPYGYEPPSYEPQSAADNDDEAPKPKKKSIMDDDDDDDFPSMKSSEKSKADKDRENEEMFRKAAEEDAKRAAAQQSSKKGWGFGGWFGGSKKAALEPSSSGESSPGKPIRAKLGEASSFVYDPDLKRWVNKKPGAENTPAKTATPPPPKAGPRSVSGTPPPPTGTPPPPLITSNSAPPPLMPPKVRAGTPELMKQASTESLGLAPPAMARSVSNTSNASAPPSRPTTSMSNASSIDDLLSAAPRKASDKKKARKGGRYVDVMAK
ncbi:vesicle coat component [Fusarium irregulare]|uniref:Protein transport protein sec16 n=1 Tax=Fusarium irregulare TaxID=2494466 RepID=A0A9W8PZM7_9HYPO|nr:vesicle coat component [Fusarium irregulare]KAJ4025220.1 vesicle coat component [Fusarium irregulare]